MQMQDCLALAQVDDVDALTSRPHHEPSAGASRGHHSVIQVHELGGMVNGLRSTRVDGHGPSLVGVIR